MNKLSILITMLSFFLAGCLQLSGGQLHAQELSKAGNSQVKNKQSQLWQEVTVKYFDFEGGFFGLLAKDGQKLLPMNLAKEFKVDGTVLKVKGHVIKGMMTTTQWGEPFEVSEVELIKLGKKDLGQAF